MFAVVMYFFSLILVTFTHSIVFVNQPIFFSYSQKASQVLYYCSPIQVNILNFFF